MYGKGLRALSLITAASVALTLAAVFFWAPDDAYLGFLQKIFYLHVPLAILTLCGFVAAGLMAIAHLRTRDPRWDMRSYVAIHISLIFGIAVLISGSIWARGAWGHWWVWNEPTLVSFLLVMLLYATYQPLRFAIEDPERQARYASVFAITAGVFVPINFVIVRLSPALCAPAHAQQHQRQPARPDAGTCSTSHAQRSAAVVTLWRFEMTAKHVSAQMRRLRGLLGEESDEQPVRPERGAVDPLHAGTAS